MRREQLACCVGMAVLLLGCVVRSAEPAPQPASEPVQVAAPEKVVAKATRPPTFAEQLAELPPFEVVHWTWPWETDDDRWFEDAELAREFARLTGSVTVRLWTGGRLPETFAGQRQRYERRYEQAAVVIESLPAGAADLSVVYSPWHQFKGMVGLNPLTDWRRHVQILGELGTAAEHLRDWLGEHHPNIAVGRIMLDSEMFSIREDDRWNAALAEIYSGCDRTVRQVFPKAAITWYAAPNKRLGVGVIGPPIDHYNPSLYRPWNVEYVREDFFGAWSRAVCDYDGVGRMARLTACISLGSAYHPADPKVFCHAWDYPVANDAATAAFLRAYAETYKIDSIQIYPEPRRSRYFDKHFLAYARGWHGVGNDH